MIKIKDSKISLKGDVPTLCTDLSMIVIALKAEIGKAENDEVAEKMIHEAVDIAFLKEEEIKSKLKEIIVRIIDSFGKEDNK